MKHMNLFRQESFHLFKRECCVKPVNILVVFLILLCSTQFSFCLDQVLVYPDEIMFNYTQGTTYDAIKLKKNKNTDIPVPEFKYYVRNEKFAYLTGQSNRKIMIRFDSNCPKLKNVLINMRVESGEGFGEIYNLLFSQLY